MVVVVVAALALAGAGTVLLAGAANRREVRDDLEDKARDAAELLRTTGLDAPGALPDMRALLEVDGVTTAFVRSSSLDVDGVHLSADDLR